MTDFVLHPKDPLVAQAALEQYRSRSAYKLIELDDKHHFLRTGSVVVRRDLYEPMCS